MIPLSIIKKIANIYNRNIEKRLLKSFARCGSNVQIGRGCIFNSTKMIELGNNVSIGPNAVMYSIYKRIIFGNNVLLGPGVTMVSGDHNISKIGVPIIDNHEKMPGDDADIIIEDDVWIGANVTILKGVTIGRGVVVGAGAVCVKSIPAYCIAGGVPAKVIGIRFCIDQIVEHERILYNEDKRMTLESLKHINDYKNKQHV